MATKTMKHHNAKLLPLPLHQDKQMTSNNVIVRSAKQSRIPVLADIQNTNASFDKFVHKERAKTNTAASGINAQTTAAAEKDEIKETK